VKSSYIRGGEREIQLHSGRGKGNPVTFGERKGKSSCIWEGKREIQLHPGREKGNPVTSGERKG